MRPRLYGAWRDFDLSCARTLPSITLQVKASALIAGLWLGYHCSWVKDAHYAAYIL